MRRPRTGTRNLLLSCLLGSALIVASCGGGGGGGGGSASVTPGTAPSGLAYPQSVVLLTTSIEAASLAPSVSGAVNAYSIAPDLPAGLVLDPQTGVLSGTPTEVSARRLYLITASNSVGSTSTTVDLSVSQPARRMLVGGNGSEVSTMLFDAPSGKLRHHVHAPVGGAAPDQLATHPRLSVFYALRNSGDVLQAFSMPADSSEATSISILNLGAGPHEMVVHPDGETLYVTSQTAGTVQAVALDNQGAMSTLGAPLAVGPKPGPLAIPASGDFLLVGNLGTSPSFPGDASIETITLDANGGLLPATTTQATNGAIPTMLATQGDRMYMAPSNFQFVLGFDIDPVSGVLTPIVPGVPTDGIPTALALSPGGPWMIAVLGNDDAYQRFALDPVTGLVQSSGASISVGNEIAAATYDRSGSFFYMAVPAFEGILAQTVDPDTGSLAPNAAYRTRGPATMLALWAGDQPLVPQTTGLVSLDEGSAEARAFTIDPLDRGLDPIAGPLPLPGINSDPVALAADPLGEFMFVSSKTDRLLWSIPVLADGSLDTPPPPATPVNDPIAVAVDPSGRTVYVAGSLFGQVEALEIDRSTGVLTTISSITPGGNLSGLAVDRTGRYLALLDDVANQVRLVTLNNGALGGVVNTLSLSSRPTSLAFSNDGVYLDITLGDVDQIQVLRLDSLIDAFVLVGAPYDLELGTMPSASVRSALRPFAFAASAATGELVVIDTPNETTLVPRSPTVAVGTSLSDLVVAPDGGALYAVDTLGGTVVPVLLSPEGQVTVGSAVPAGLTPTEAELVVRYGD